MSDHERKTGGNAALQDDVDVQTPRRYRVLLHNDHYTTMEFVVEVLLEVFHKPSAEAHQIMMQVHRNGAGTAGVYVKSIAESKVLAVHQRARQAGYPLRSSLEPE